MNSKYKKIYTIIILTLPITALYKSIIPGVSIGELLIISMLPIIIFFVPLYKKNFLDALKNPFSWLAIYIILGSLVSVLIQQTGFSSIDIFVRSIRYLFYLFCAIYLSSILFDINFCLLWYRRLAIFATSYLILQIIIYNTTGYFLQGTIPGLSFTNEFYDFEKNTNLLSHFYRPYSIFTEPGQYAQFTLPFLVYCLFWRRNNEKPKIIEAVFITVGLFLSTSGQGLLLGISIWVLWFILNSYNASDKKISLLTIFISIAFIFILPFVLQIQEIETSMNRLFGTSDASANLRIFRGFAVFDQLDLIYKLIGVGFGNVGAFIIMKGITTSYDSAALPEYMNSIANVMVSLGLIGLFILICAFIYMFINTKQFHRVCLLLLLVLSGVGSILLSSNMILYISLIMSGFIKKKINRNDSST